jgi:hypothetical protein
VVRLSGNARHSVEQGFPCLERADVCWVLHDRLHQLVQPATFEHKYDVVTGQEDSVAFETKADGSKGGPISMTA